MAESVPRRWPSLVNTYTFLTFAMLSATSVQAACSVNGNSFSAGAAACLPNIVGADVKSVLHECDGETWRSLDKVCPDRFTYFCQIGPNAVPLGTILTLGTGPQSLECRFPGTLHLVHPGGGASGVATNDPSANRPSDVVRRVQIHLMEEGGATDLCPSGTCSGLFDDQTRAALVEFISENFNSLTPDERKGFGLTGRNNIETALGQMSQIDLIPHFVEVFGVADLD